MLVRFHALRRKRFDRVLLVPLIVVVWSLTSVGAVTISANWTTDLRASCSEGNRKSEMLTFCVAVIVC